MKCYIAQDLLPGYIDGVTSEQTNRELEEHLQECMYCADVHAKMVAALPKQVLVYEAAMEQTGSQKRVDSKDDGGKSKKNKKQSSEYSKNPKSRNQTEENQNQVKYLKKCHNTVKRAIIVSMVCILLLFTGIAGIVMLWMKDNSEIVKDISQYEYVLGKEGKYKEHFNRYNDIFPDQLPASAVVNEFEYNYYNPWDPCYTGILVYSCDEKDYENEYERLTSLKSTDLLPYGATGFPYELCAMYSHFYYGIIYVMTDPDTHTFIYVEIQFCNFYTDTDYNKIIDAKYLPYDFDALKDNPMYKKKHPQ